MNNENEHSKNGVKSNSAFLPLITNAIREVDSREYLDIEGLKKKLRHKSQQSSRNANKALRKISTIEKDARPENSMIEKKKAIEVMKIKSGNSARKNRNQLERLRQKENSLRPAPIGVENSIRAISGGLPETSRK